MYSSRYQSFIKARDEGHTCRSRDTKRVKHVPQGLIATDLSQAPSLAQGGGFPSIDGDRLLLAGLAGPQQTPARPMRRTGVQNVRMGHMLDRLTLVRFARLVGLVGLGGLVDLVSLVGVCGPGLKVGRSVCRYHWRGVIRIEGVSRLRSESRIALYPNYWRRNILNEQFILHCPTKARCHLKSFPAQFSYLL